MVAHFVNNAVLIAARATPARTRRRDTRREAGLVALAAGLPRAARCSSVAGDAPRGCERRDDAADHRYVAYFTNFCCRTRFAWLSKASICRAVRISRLVGAAAAGATSCRTSRPTPCRLCCRGSRWAPTGRARSSTCRATARRGSTSWPGAHQDLEGHARRQGADARLPHRGRLLRRALPAGRRPARGDGRGDGRLDDRRDRARAARRPAQARRRRRLQVRARADRRAARIWRRGSSS